MVLQDNAATLYSRRRGREPGCDHPRTQRGTYSIQNQTIIFNFTDGPRGMRTFLAPKAQERDQVFDWISLGIDLLYEEHHVNEP